MCTNSIRELSLEALPDDVLALALRKLRPTLSVLLTSARLMRVGLDRAWLEERCTVGLCHAAEWAHMDYFERTVTAAPRRFKNYQTSLCVLNAACKGGAVDIVRYISDHRLCRLSSSRNSALRTAVSAAHIDVVRILLSDKV